MYVSVTLSEMVFTSESKTIWPEGVWFSQVELSYGWLRYIGAAYIYISLCLIFVCRVLICNGIKSNPSPLTPIDTTNWFLSDHDWFHIWRLYGYSIYNGFHIWHFCSGSGRPQSMPSRHLTATCVQVSAWSRRLEKLRSSWGDGIWLQWLLVLETILLSRQATQGSPLVMGAWITHTLQSIVCNVRNTYHHYPPTNSTHYMSWTIKIYQPLLFGFDSWSVP